MTKEKVLPEVGTPCTIVFGSDNYPAKVEMVSQDLKTIWVSEPEGEMTEYTLRKNGVYYERGQKMGGGCFYLRIGVARSYRDPSF